MAAKRERIFSGFFAALFLITSSALTIIVVVSLAGGSSNSTNSGTNSTSSTSTKPTGKNAAGTKLSGFTPVASVPTLKATDLSVGTGATVTPTDTITVNYTGAVADTGIIFQSTEITGGQPATLALNQVIPGWTEGIPGMKVGGTRQLLIPASLAYGANPPSGSGIPANANLVFNVTVEKIAK